MIVVVIAIASYILPKYLGDLDELWIYNSAKNIADGLLPYKDFNLVTTPFLPLLAGGILKILPNELLVMRVLAIGLITVIIFMIAKIMNKIEVNQYLIALSVIGMIFLLQDYFCIDYNFINLLLLLCIIYLEIDKAEKNEYNIKFVLKQDFLIGILAGLSVGFKQTTGVIICMIAIANHILIIKGKREWKQYLKISLARILGILIPIGVLIIYLSIYQLWPSFIDYGILGVREFTNVISYTRLFDSEKIAIKILASIFPITLIYMYFNTVVINLKTEEKRKQFYLFTYSVASSAVIFPISDEIHFLIGIIPSIIGMIYILNLFIKWINRKIKQDKLKIFIKEFLKCGMILLVAINSLNNVKKLSEYFQEIKNQKTFAHYAYIPISDGIYNGINTIASYIKQEKKVYILDASAAIFKIPLDLYDKNYDLFLKGNLGNGGSNKLIKELESIEDAKILIKKTSRNWQTPEDVIQFVEKHKQKTGEIDLFDVYE